MKPTQQLHELGQRLWLDAITRTMLDDGTVQRHIDWCSLTGLTLSPAIIQKAVTAGSAYDGEIRAAPSDLATEDLFIRMALSDLCRAADLFRPAHETSEGMDGWVSMKASPLLAGDSQATITAARRLHHQGQRSNLFIEIPGTPSGLEAITELIFAGIPVNVTLLFSPQQCLAAADAWMTGIERRVAAGLDPRVHSVASLFVDRWDIAVAGKAPHQFTNRLGIANATQAWCAWNKLYASARWQRLNQAGTAPQRLLWASTGAGDPLASDVLYAEALIAPGTINTLPEKTLLAFADHGRVGALLPVDGGDSAQILARFHQAGIDVDALAGQLQDESLAASIESWRTLMAGIEQKRRA